MQLQGNLTGRRQGRHVQGGTERCRVWSNVLIWSQSGDVAAVHSDTNRDLSGHQWHGATFAPQDEELAARSTRESVELFMMIIPIRQNWSVECGLRLNERVQLLRVCQVNLTEWSDWPEIGKYGVQAPDWKRNFLEKNYFHSKLLKFNSTFFIRSRVALVFLGYLHLYLRRWAFT